MNDFKDTIHSIVQKVLYSRKKVFRLLNQNGSFKTCLLKGFWGNLEMVLLWNHGKTHHLEPL